MTAPQKWIFGDFPIRWAEGHKKQALAATQSDFLWAGHT
jgi:hypothetical protein